MSSQCPQIIPQCIPDQSGADGRELNKEWIRAVFRKGLGCAIISMGKIKMVGYSMEKRNIISGLLIAVLLFLEIGCDTSGGGTAAVKYDISDTGPSGVGIVFYITDDGLHGLEVAPSDQSISQVWIEGGSTQTTVNENTGTAIGTGLANSNAIIAQTGHTGSGALVCREYNGGGLTDWYLPSREELDAIWDNLVNDGTGSNSGVGGFAVGYYWSSSEVGSGLAWNQYFNDGFQYPVSKNYVQRVRAVRAF